MTLNLEEVLEVAHIAAIMGVEVDFDKWYNKQNNGYIQSTYNIAELALEFYLKHKDCKPEYWEERFNSEGSWDEIISKYIKNKLEN